MHRGAHRRRRQEHDGIGAVATVILEIMLDGAHMAVAERVDVTDQLKALGEIDIGRLRRGSDVGKELNAEFHRAPARVPAGYIAVGRTRQPRARSV